MTTDYAAEILRDPDGCAVVVRAEPIIHIADELMRQADAHSEPTPTGELWCNSPAFGFGTVGRGLGALTYVLTGEIVTSGPGVMYVAKREASR